MPATVSSLGAAGDTVQLSKRIRRKGPLKSAGGSANAVNAADAMFASMGESPERKPGANRARNGLTARRDGKNTSREGRFESEREAELGGHRGRSMQRM